MRLIKYSSTFSIAYILILLILSILSAIQIIKVEIGIYIYIFSIFGLCFLYSFLFKLSEDLFNKYFLLLVSIGIITKVFFSFNESLWEDDWARYLWEGQLIKEGISPYQVSPIHFYQKVFDKNLESRGIEILSRINHPEWTTIYFPIILFYFYLCAIISPYSFIILKIGYLLFDLLTLSLISKLKNNKAGILYFLFPILIKETYINGHFEIICIFLITLSFWLRKRNFINFSNLIFGLSVSSKPFLVFLFPFYLFTKIKYSNWRESFLKFLQFFLLCSIGFLFPFIFFQFMISHNGLFGMTELIKFANEFEFNPLFFYLFRLFLDYNHARYLSLFILVIFLLVTIYKNTIIFENFENGIHWMFYSFLVYLILTPIANPWYFLILVPLYFVSFPTLKKIWLIICVPQMAYLTFTNLKLNNPIVNYGFYSLPYWVMLIELVAIINIMYHFKFSNNKK
ncbi:MAG: hypothetical protein SFU98_02700 [Leptospiraceae bacterium]|nr:hypothetical protein [Leptospiraceae bacterium]